MQVPDLSFATLEEYSDGTARPNLGESESGMSLSVASLQRIIKFSHNRGVVVVSDFLPARQVCGTGVEVIDIPVLRVLAKKSWDVWRGRCYVAIWRHLQADAELRAIVGAPDSVELADVRRNDGYGWVVVAEPVVGEYAHFTYYSKNKEDGTFVQPGIALEVCRLGMGLVLSYT